MSNAVPSYIRCTVAGNVHPLQEMYTLAHRNKTSRCVDARLSSADTGLCEREHDTSKHMSHCLDSSNMHRGRIYQVCCAIRITFIRTFLEIQEENGLREGVNCLLTLLVGFQIFAEKKGTKIFLSTLGQEAVLRKTGPEGLSIHSNCLSKQIYLSVRSHSDLVELLLLFDHGSGHQLLAALAPQFRQTAAFVLEE